MGEKLRVLHISNLSANPANGVNVVVPKHVYYQSQTEDVALVDINNQIVLEHLQLRYQGIKGFPYYLPSPFSRPDIVIFHEVNVLEYIRIFKQLRKNKIPYILIPHGELTKQALRKKYLKKKIAYIFLFNTFVNCASAIQCLSQRELENIHFNPKKFIGTNGVEIPLLHKELFSEKGIRFVYIGRLDAYHKGLDLLLSAVRLVSDDMREYKCKILLYGPNYNGWAKHLLNLIHLYRIEDIVTLNEAVFGKEKEKILLDADVFIQTSRFEGMPLGILEALSYGIPCLITEGTTLGNFVRDNDAGWVVETKADSIAFQIKKIISEAQEFNVKGVNAKNLILTHFNWSKICTKTLNFYRNILME